MATTGISLHIGLNAVDPGHYAGWSGPLNACEADAEDMESTARQAGFQTTRLITRAATGAALREQIQAAADRLQSGDFFLVTYSGHGGQLPDRDHEEPDGLDETWCLYDGQVVDDELYQLWSRFRAGVRILVVSDSCHSGTVIRQYRELGMTSGGRALLGDTHEDPSAPLRFRAMPPDVGRRTYRQNRAYYDDYIAKLPAEKDSLRALSATVRLLSGCQDAQVSLDGAFNGLFTGTLLQVWGAGRFAGNYAQFHAEIRHRMPPTQVPGHLVVGPSNPGFDAQKPFTI